MATLYITEYTRQGGDTRAVMPTGEEPATASQTVAIGGASAQSSAFGTHTRLVRLHTDAICSVRFGDNPTATTGHARMAANQTEFFGVVPGQKVAVITNT